jgi:hypothetical protein
MKNLVREKKNDDYWKDTEDQDFLSGVAQDL